MPISKTTTAPTCGPTAAQTLDARLTKLGAQVSSLEANDSKAVNGGIDGLEFIQQGRQFMSTFDSAQTATAAIQSAAKSGDITKAQEKRMLGQVDQFELRSAKSILPVIENAPWWVKPALNLVPGLSQKLVDAQAQLDGIK
jgi:hypothetical protein